MVHFLILRFLLVLFSFNLIERCHSMEKKANFDIEMELFRNLIAESRSWIVYHQQNSLIKETEHRFLYKLWNKSSRNTSKRPRFRVSIQGVISLWGDCVVFPRFGTWNLCLCTTCQCPRCPISEKRRDPPKVI